MDAYVYQAAMICADCAEAVKRELTTQGKAPANPDDTATFDSQDFPKGPYPEGGGESDSPQHCDRHAACLNAVEVGEGVKVGVFLENPLTQDGYREMLRMVLSEWENPGKVVQT